MDEYTRRRLALEDAETESVETLEAGAAILRALHDRDEDCTLDEDDSCTVCGVWHGDPCACGGRGFHREGCAEYES